MAEASQWTSEGRALGGSGGRARVAAWEAMGPRQFPPTHLPPRSSLVALIYAGEEAGGLAGQPGRL
jgi:hypothetical protein